MTDAILRISAALEGRYRIEREIGQGGMATVHLAEDLRHHRKVAIKVLKPELAAIVGGRRFLREIETTARLQHPHILPLFDSGEAAGFLFYVTPFVEGESLRAKLDRERQLSIEDAIDIATKVASALGYAHRQGVVHRDIKPGNVLLTEGGEPVVADFGIALAVARAGVPRVTETGVSPGTPQYMSPEQATGDGEISARSDVYSLGCTLYEMLIGDPPYVGSTAQVVLGKILTGDVPEPARVRASIPPNVDAAIRRSLEKLPADRFDSATAFAAALADRSFRYGEATGENPHAAWRSWVAFAIGASTLAVAFAAAFAWLLLRPTESSPVSRFEVTLPEGVELVTQNGVNLALSPDGTNFVFVGVSEGVQQLWMRPIGRLNAMPMRGTEGATNPRFSPDGEEVAFVDQLSASLKVAPVSGAPPRTLVVDSVVAAGGGLAWDAAGFVYFKKLGTDIFRVSADGGRVEEVTRSEAGRHEWPEVLPDGRGLLVTLNLGGPSEDSIAVFSFETGEIRTLVQGAMGRYSRSGHLLYASAEGTLLAADLNVDRLEVGPPRPILSDVQVNVGSASQFAVADAGALAYRPRLSDATPVWVDPDGSTTPLDALLMGRFGSPSISPDGSMVAFDHTPPGGLQNIWVYHLEYGTLDRLTFGGGTHRNPSWAADGTEVGFVRHYDGRSELYTVPADASGPARPVLYDPERTVGEALWLPDGGIVYRRGALAGGSEIYHMAPGSGGGATALAGGSFLVFSPALDRDGEWLAYTSNESGQNEVYVRPFPGPGGRFPVSSGGGRDPVWLATGEGILYTDAEGYLVTATVRTDPDFAVLSSETHSDWPRPSSPYLTQNYAIAPTDGRVLMIPSDGTATATRDVIIQNFFEELRRLSN